MYSSNDYQNLTQQIIHTNLYGIPYQTENGFPSWNSDTKTIPKHPTDVLPLLFLEYSGTPEESNIVPG